MKNQWENPGVRGRGQYIVGVKALPNGHAFVGSDIFPQLPSLYGILQNKGYFLSCVLLSCFIPSNVLFSISVLCFLYILLLDRVHI